MVSFGDAHGLDAVLSSPRRLYLLDANVIDGRYSSAERRPAYGDLPLAGREEVNRALQASLGVVQQTPAVYVTGRVLREIHRYKILLARNREDIDRENRTLVSRIWRELRRGRVVYSDSKTEGLAAALRLRFREEYPMLRPASPADAEIVAVAFSGRLPEPVDIVSADLGVMLLAAMAAETPGFKQRQVRVYGRRKDEDFRIWYDAAERRPYLDIPEDWFRRDFSLREDARTGPQPAAGPPEEACAQKPPTRYTGAAPSPPPARARPSRSA